MNGASMVVMNERRASQTHGSSFLYTIVGAGGSLRSFSTVGGRGRYEHNRLNYRRDRHRQGIIARAIPSSAPVETEICQGELRGDACRASRKRALRHERGAFYGRRQFHVGRSRWPIAALCSSMKLETCHWSFNPSCSACSKDVI